MAILRFLRTIHLCESARYELSQMKIKTVSKTLITLVMVFPDSILGISAMNE